MMGWREMEMRQCTWSFNIQSFRRMSAGHTFTHQREKPLTETSNTSKDGVSIFAYYLGSRSQPTATSWVSKAHCGLFCMDIKYFSLSSNSVF